MNILIRPSSCIFLLLLLLKSPLKGEGVDLVKRWEISDPRAIICEEGTCNDPLSSIRLEYTINKQAKYAKYRIFEKDCEEEFDDGTEPVRGTTPSGKEILNKDIDPFTAMSLSPESNEDDDTTTASAEFSPVIASLSSWSSWWKDIKKKMRDDDDPNSADKRTIEFCIRMSLWTSSKSDAMEVNFRETVVAVTYYDTKDKDNKTEEKDDDVSSSDDTNIQKLEFGVESVIVIPKPLRGVEVNIMGSSATIGNTDKNRKGSDSIQNDEL